MKHKLLLMMLAMATGILTAQAQIYKTAIGGRLSTTEAAVNNSLSVKYFINRSTALEALVCFDDPIAVGAMIEFHNPVSPRKGLTWMYGAGGYIGFTEERNIGAMAIFGLDYKFVNLPLNFTLDWKPEFSLVREFSFEPVAFGLSARFTF